MWSFQAYPQGMERNAVMMNTYNYARPVSPSSFSASGISRVMTILAIPIGGQCTVVNLHKQYTSTSTACASMTANVSLFIRVEVEERPDVLWLD